MQKRPLATIPCGFRYEVQGADKKSRAATDVERAAWWSDASGIPPGAGVALAAPQPGHSTAQPQCRAEKRRDPGIAAAIDATAAVAPASKDLPVLIIHGRNDGLVPIHYSSIPYMAMLAEQGHTRAALWNVNNAQHFDAFLGFPSYGSKWTPLLPYVYRGLDQMWSVITEGKPMPVSQMIEPNGKRPFAY